MKKIRPWLYLLPSLILLGIFMIYPLFDVLVYSMQEGYNSASQTYSGIGFYNFSYVLRDPYFLQAVKIHFLLVIITVPLSTGWHCCFLWHCLRSRKSKELYQTIYFLPYVTNTLAVGLVFAGLLLKTPYSDGFIRMIIQFFLL